MQPLRLVVPGIGYIEEQTQVINDLIWVELLPSGEFALWVTVPDFINSNGHHDPKEYMNLRKPGSLGLSLRTQITRDGNPTGKTELYLSISDIRACILSGGFKGILTARSDPLHGQIALVEELAGRIVRAPKTLSQNLAVQTLIMFAGKALGALCSKRRLRVLYLVEEGGIRYKSLIPIDGHPGLRVRFTGPSHHEDDRINLKIILSAMTGKHPWYANQNLEKIYTALPFPQCHLPIQHEPMKIEEFSWATVRQLLRNSSEPDLEAISLIDGLDEKQNLGRELFCTVLFSGRVIRDKVAHRAMTTYLREVAPRTLWSSLDCAHQQGHLSIHFSERFVPHSYHCTVTTTFGGKTIRKEARCKWSVASARALAAEMIAEEMQAV